eukprot:CAMPEP_0116147600 /NCGR_PEP_ID=MMETSP0329-20121206/17844_1 /TAXON_ID=697910 /ORGANISM="Pseudo-nitzschia arenysensis, Strain B593" /LENGTH=153 /DNA_ID=CAMNT_0003643545 /DNA_START=142 /DNA_END=603 /DNA_ORIENTATION=+
MNPSTSNDSGSQLLRPRLVRSKPIRRKRDVEEIGHKSLTRNKSNSTTTSTSTSTSAMIRDETMELLPMPPRKRLRRAEKVYPSSRKDKSFENNSSEPWWMGIQIGNEAPGSFNEWLGKKTDTGMDELDRENDAYSSRSTSLNSIDTSCSEFSF